MIDYRVCIHVFDSLFLLYVLVRITLFHQSLILQIVMWTKNKTKCWFSLEKKLLWAMCVAIYAHFQPIVAFERRNCPGDFMVIKIGPWNIYESNMILISSKLRCFVPARHPLRGFVESTSAYWPNLALTYFNIEKHRTPVKKCAFDLDPDLSSFVAWPKIQN